MRFTSLFLTALAASGAVAKRTCGAPKPSEEQKLVAQNFLLEELEAKKAGKVSAAAAINVNIYYHVVASSSSASGGYLTQAQLTAQTNVLNQAYASSGVAFTQAGADWTINSQWASDRSELAMKRALRKGTYADLNVYFIRTSQYLGYAYFPENVSTGSTQFILDGVVAVSSSVPGGTAPYDLGHTLTHEAGHWFGLEHTFGEGDGSCPGTGDFVSDTPAEAEPAYGCEIGRDSCPSQSGLDPVQNYMDYSDDDCFTNFSAGQSSRMASMWNTYRA